MGFCSRARCCKWSCGFVGLIFLVTGCVLIHVFNTLIHNKVDDNLPLKNGSDSYKNWMVPPAPIYFQIYVLDIVNHDEVVQNGAKPVLMQKGPYTYREKRKKFQVHYEKDGIISYRERQSFYFDLSRSVGPETDNFTTVNLPMITIANLVRYEYGWLQTLVNAILDATDEHLFINLSVAELMWGYEDNLLKKVKEVAADFNISFSDTFGLFLNKNNSDDGVYRIKSGLDNTVDQFAEIVSWNGESALNFWTTDSANKINGSDGTLYPPFVDTSKTYYLFSSDLCRSLEIHYNEAYTLKGIDVNRFVVPPLAFANSSVNPANEGFCTPTTANCLPAGLLNASVCRDGAPVILSLPHFLDGDPDIRHRVIGMNPVREEHQSVIDIEPMTGVVMNAAKRLQMNAYLTKLPHITDTDKFQDYIIMPILWLNESAKLDDKSASDFKSEVLTAVKVTEAVQYGLIALGSFLLACVVFAIIKSVFCQSKDRELQPMGETTPILGTA